MKEIKIDKNFPDEVRQLLYDARKEETLLKKVETAISQVRRTTKRYAELGIAKKELIAGIKLAKKIEEKYRKGGVEERISEYQTRLRNGLRISSHLYDPRAEKEGE